MDIVKWLQDKIQSLTQPNALSPAAQAINPNVVGFAQNALQQIGQGNLTPTAPKSAQDVAAMAGGPITQYLFGSPIQKQQVAAAGELAGDVQGAKNIAGGIQGLLNMGSKPVTSALPSTPPKTPVAPTTAMTAPMEGQVLKEAPKVFTSPAGVEYPFKTAEEMASKMSVGGAINKFLSSPLTKLAEFVGITTAIGSQVPNAIGLWKSIMGKTSAAMTPESAASLAAQSEKDLGDPFASGNAVKTVDLTNAQNAITQLQGSKEYQAKKLTDPFNQYTAPIDAAATQLNRVAQTQNDYVNTYAETLALDQQYNNIISQLQGTTGIGQASNVYNFIMGSKDPSLGALKASINSLADQKVDIKSILNADGPTALASLNTAKQQMLAKWNAAKEIYGNMPLTIPAIPTPPAAPTGGVPASSVIGAPAWAGGGAGAGLPKAGAKGLPPLQPNGLPMKHKVQIPPKYLYR